MLERAPVVDHHRLAAGADQPRHQLLHQHRLARAGLSRHGHVVVAGVVRERRPARGLTAPADEEQRRRVVRPGRLSPPLAVHRREVDRRRGEERLQPPHPGEVGIEPARRHHGQAGEPGGELHVALGVHPPALAVIDRAHRLLGLVDGFDRRVDRRHVAGTDQPLPVAQPLGHRLPVARLLRKPRQVARDAGAGLLGRAGGLEERLLPIGLLAGHHRQAGEHRTARLEEVAVEVADERVAAPAGPDLGEGDGREHPHRHVVPVRMVEDEPGRRDREGAPGGRALLMQRVVRRPAPARALEPAVAISRHVGRDQLGREREQPVRVEAPRLRARGRERPFERAAKRPELGLRRRAGEPGERRADEGAVVGERVGRAARMERAPPGMAEHPAPARAHRPERAARTSARLGPGGERRAESRARPVHHLYRAPLRRRVGERAAKRPQRLLVDPRERRDLDDEPGARGVDVELARFVEGAPGQQRVQRLRHCRRRPGLGRLGPLEELHQAADHRTLQPAGSSTTRT